MRRVLQAALSLFPVVWTFPNRYSLSLSLSVSSKVWWVSCFWVLCESGAVCIVGLVLGGDLWILEDENGCVLGWSVVYVFVGFLVNTSNVASGGCVTLKDREPEGEDRLREMKKNQ